MAKALEESGLGWGFSLLVGGVLVGAWLGASLVWVGVLAGSGFGHVWVWIGVRVENCCAGGFLGSSGVEPTYSIRIELKVYICIYSLF